MRCPESREKREPRLCRTIPVSGLELEQVPLHALPGPGQGQCARDEQKYDAQQRGDDQFAGPLDSGAQAVQQHRGTGHDDHARAGCLEQERAEREPVRGRQDRPGIQGHSGQRQKLRQGVVQHPAQRVGVIRGGCGDHDEEEPARLPAPWQAGGGERTHGAATGLAAQGPLGDQGRHAEQHNGQYVDQHERRSAELTHHVGEAPDVAQPHRDSDHRGQQGESRRERLAYPRARRRLIGSHEPPSRR